MDIKELTKLLKLPNTQFEGHLVLNDHKTIWTLHFVQGRLIYAVDGLHPVRRWNRTLNEYFPKFHLDIQPAQISDRQHWQLYLLDQGFKRQQLSLVRAKVMLRAVIQECLFELSQCAYATSDWQQVELPISRFCRTIALSPWEIQMTMNKVKDMQREWKRLGMAGGNPTLSPTLKKPIDPQRLQVPHPYITGKYTLWHIASKLSKPVGEITKSLLPLVQDESLELKTLPDLPLAAVRLSATSPPVVQTNTQTNPSVVAMPQSFRPSPSSSIAAKPYESIGSRTIPAASPAPGATPPKPEAISPGNDNQPLIACIDDSPVLAHSLKKILATGGYRTLIIQEPMQGFSQLIEHLPSLILLDVMLPNADGYNICRFLRDTPVFKDTPIIILTGRSKPVDRARASMAGATEFLVKPPEANELLQMIHKHLRKDEKLSG
ncbi:MAG: response regulator [Cyanobacteria bacterium J06656_5]